MKPESKIQAVDTVAGGLGPILIVDDSRVQRRILGSLLTKMGHQVLEFEFARDALEACKQHRTSIVVSDWMMPEMDGLRFCKELRSLKLPHYVYFILLTSKGEKVEIAEGLDAGADDFLTKPVNGVELRARILAGKRILKAQDDLQLALGELQTLYDAVDRDLIEARKLQLSLIRDPVQHYGTSRVDLFLQSSGRVGGDLVGSYAINDSAIGLYSIDVSGHGVASALLSARLAGQLSSTAPEQNIALERSGDGFVGVAPAKAVKSLNRLLLDEIETEHYFTICLAEIDLKTGRGVFCQAGHPPPAILRGDGNVEFLGTGGMPVGLIDDASFEDNEFHLGRQDRILLYSDGVTECENDQAQFFEETGLANVLSHAANQPDRNFFNMLLEELEDFARRSDFADDISGALFAR